MKSVQIQSYFWSVFFRIQSEYRKIRTRNNSVFGHFSRSDSFFENVILSVLKEQKQDCEKEISEKEVRDALKSFSNNKSPANDGLNKEF